MAEDDVIFVFNEPGMEHTFKSWTGPVGTSLEKKTVELETLGKGAAGFDTGALIESISSTYGKHESSGDLEAKTGANPNGSLEQGYAYYHHEGTYPHEIRPKRPGGVLRFRSGGMVVYVRRVFHPGTEPTKFLTRWLRDLFA